MNALKDIAMMLDQLAVEKAEAERNEAVYSARHSQLLCERTKQEIEYNAHRTRQAKAEADQAEHAAEMQRLSMERMKEELAARPLRTNTKGNVQ